MTKLTLTTALALLAGTALASAQGMQPGAGNDTQRAAPAPAAQQHAPAEKLGPMHRAQAPGKAETTGQASGKADMNAKPGTDKPEMKGNAELKGEAGKPNIKANEKAEMKGGMNGKPQHNAAETDKSKPDNNKSAAEQKSGKTNAQIEEKNKTNAQVEEHNKTQTTGQGAAAARGAANLSTEQRTKIRTVFREKVHVQPVTHVNFSINVGTRVPRTVHYHPLPAEVVEVYPAWRGYNFILVNDEIVIIDPATFEIVAILT